MSEAKGNEAEGSGTDGVRTLPSKWGPVALVCRKCGKKLGGGFGKKGRQDLGKVLARTLKEAGRRRDLRLAESPCLGICPKGAVAVALSDRVLVVAPGTDPARVIEAAGAGDSSRPGRTARTG